jgi:Transmembrane proteins 230/134
MEQELSLKGSGSDTPSSVARMRKQAGVAAATSSSASSEGTSQHASSNPVLDARFSRTTPARRPNDFDDSGWPEEREVSGEFDAPGSGSDLYEPAIGRPRRRFVKTITAAVLLFTVGSVMLWLGVKNLYVDKDRAIAMLVLGGLMFIPGSYASFILLGSWLQWAGYRAEDLPSYDDD